MKACLSGVLAACALAGAVTTAYAEMPNPPVDWVGIWNPHERNIFDPSAFVDPRNKTADGNAAYMREYPPYKPEWEARYVKKLADNKAGIPTDPHASCVPGGMPRTMVIPYPSEYVVTPTVVYILSEETSQVRRIFTDGRKHPTGDDLEHTYQGHSIGHWEGDTLVVDTVGMRGDTVYDVTAAPHSDQVHEVERIRRISPTQMEDVMAIDDPLAFTRQWVIRRTYDLKPDWNITEYVCEENNRNPIQADGSTKTGVVKN
jgi:hypothetical protein